MEVGSRFLCPRGGLCLCWGVTIDQQRQNRRLQSLLPRPKGPRHHDQGIPPALTGSASHFRLQGERPSGDSTDVDSSPRRPPRKLTEPRFGYRMGKGETQG